MNSKLFFTPDYTYKHQPVATAVVIATVGWRRSFTLRINLNKGEEKEMTQGCLTSRGRQDKHGG